MDELNKIEKEIFKTLLKDKDAQVQERGKIDDTSIQNAISNKITNNDEFLFYRIIKYIQSSKNIKSEFEKDGKFVAEGNIFYELVEYTKDKEIIDLLKSDVIDEPLEEQYKKLREEYNKEEQTNKELEEKEEKETDENKKEKIAIQINNQIDKLEGIEQDLGNLYLKLNKKYPIRLVNYLNKLSEGIGAKSKVYNLIKAIEKFNSDYYKNDINGFKYTIKDTETSLNTLKQKINTQQGGKTSKKKKTARKGNKSKNKKTKKRRHRR